MHADLVCTSRDGAADKHTRVGCGVVRQALKERAALFALRMHDIKTALAVHTQNRLSAVDDSVWEAACHSAHIRLVHETRVKVIAELTGSLLGRRADHNTRGEAVEAVARVQMR